MTGIIIVILIAAIYGIPATLGYYMAPMYSENVDRALLVHVLVMFGIIATVFAVFRYRKDEFRVPIKAWYSFEYGVILSVGAGFAFAAGSFLALHAPLPAVMIGGVAALFVVRAVVRGSVFGWQDFIGNRVRQ